MEESREEGDKKRIERERERGGGVGGGDRNEVGEREGGGGDRNEVGERRN